MNENMKNITFKSGDDELFSKEAYQNGFNLVGKAGSGMSTYLKSNILVPALQEGRGFFYVEGKGDFANVDNIKQMLEKYNKEKDLQIIDFSGRNDSDSASLSLLENGSADGLTETLVNFFSIMSGENAWVSDMAMEFMTALLFPLVVLRDLDLMVSRDDIVKIHSLEDFNNHKKVKLTLHALSGYLSYEALIDLVYMFKSLLDDENFNDMLSSNKEYKDIKDFSSIKGRLTPLVNFLQRRGVDVLDVETKPNYAELEASVKKMNSYAVTSWTKAFATFGNETFYSTFFNDEKMVSLAESVKNNKIILVVLPSMQASVEKSHKMVGALNLIVKSYLASLLTGKVKESANEPYLFVYDGVEVDESIVSLLRAIDNKSVGLVSTSQE